jgi:hypothetical protein
MRNHEYETVRLYKRDGFIDCRVHRLVLATFIGPGDGLEANHKNARKDDNRLVNLEWVTRTENTKHAITSGLMVAHRGEKNGNSKLTDSAVRAIRKRRAKGEILRTLADAFGVTMANISYVARYDTWRHVK